MSLQDKYRKLSSFDFVGEMRRNKERLKMEIKAKSSIINIAPEEKLNFDNYVGTWKTCGFSMGGVGTDKWWNEINFENSTMRYLQLFPNGDLWFTGDWTREEGWPSDQRVEAVIKDLHSWDGKDIFHGYGKVDHPEKEDFKFIKHDNKLYFHWNDEGGGTYYVLEKVSDNPEINTISTDE
jgi:hypothetical protein